MLPPLRYALGKGPRMAWETEFTLESERSMTIQPVHPDDHVSDITVEIGLAVRERLAERYPGRIRKRLRDKPLTTVPGHTIFVPSSEAFAASGTAASTASATSQILPILVTDLLGQLHEASIPASSESWSFAFSWDGHGLFDDGRFVRDGFRFDAYVEVFAEPVA